MIATPADALTKLSTTRAGTFAIGRGYRGYVLGLLVLVGIFGWVDRNVFSVLLQSIKLEFGLSDTQLGLLGGVAFGLFYAVLGLPIALVADRFNRRSLIALALGLWSLMTTLCGLATGFASLFAARMGVGIGEAGGTPPSHSLISDYFPPEKRGFAMGVLYLYIPLGFLVGFLTAGWLNEFFGWRATFFLVGLPGVALALVLRATLREPPRGFSENARDTGIVPSFWSTIRYFLSKGTLRHIPLGGAVQGIGAFATAVWLPAHLTRVHELGSGEAGTWMAIAYGLGGGVGVLLGGYLTDLLAKKTGDARWYSWASAIAIALTAPFMIMALLTNDRVFALCALVIAIFFGHTHLGPITAMMQAVSGLRRRAMVAAFYLFFVNLIAMGVGPVLTGIISDALAVQFGNDALRYALLVVVPLSGVWAAVHFLLVSRTIRADKALDRSCV